MDNNLSENNEFDAFSAGVEPGGLRNTTQIKLLITFIAGRLKEPISSDMMLEALQVHGLANYFEATQALDELLANGNISLAEGKLYITPKGKLSVAELSEDIPRSVKETALADAINLQLMEKREGENSVEIEPTQNGFNVTFKVIHKNNVLMALTVYAADLDRRRLSSTIFSKSRQEFTQRSSQHFLFKRRSLCSNNSNSRFTKLTSSWWNITLCFSPGATFRL